MQRLRHFGWLGLTLLLGLLLWTGLSMGQSIRVPESRNRDPGTVADPTAGRAPRFISASDVQFPATPRWNNEPLIWKGVAVLSIRREGARTFAFVRRLPGSTEEPEAGQLERIPDLGFWITGWTRIDATALSNATRRLPRTSRFIDVIRRPFGR